MLTAQHIMVIRLDPRRLTAHRQMPPPDYSMKELTSQIAAIGEATLGKLLNVEPDAFQLQLELARSYGASYLIKRNGQTIGVSAATSLIKQGSILDKNLILPRDYLWKDTRLSDHFIIGVFLRGAVVDGVIPDVDQVEVAGWTNTAGVRQQRADQVPPTFRTKLPIVMVPCTQLNPLPSLVSAMVSAAAPSPTV